MHLTSRFEERPTKPAEPNAKSFTVEGLVSGDVGPRQAALCVVQRRYTVRFAIMLYSAPRFSFLLFYSGD